MQQPRLSAIDFRKVPKSADSVAPALRVRACPPAHAHRLKHKHYPLTHLNASKLFLRIFMFPCTLKHTQIAHFHSNLQFTR